MAAHVYQGLTVTAHVCWVSMVTLTAHVCWDQQWSHIYAGDQRWPFMYVEEQGWPHMSKVAAHEYLGSAVDTCMSGINVGRA